MADHFEVPPYIDFPIPGITTSSTGSLDALTMDEYHYVEREKPRKQ
jgi:hypothetical protein